MSKKATIVGAGLVGSLWAIYLAKAGYQVHVIERRSDMRLQKMSVGRSINLALSYRGWKALDEVGVGDEIRKIAIPMYGRTLHHTDGTMGYQPYGINQQAIYSVSRADINAKLMDIAEEILGNKIMFNSECIDVDLKNGITKYKNIQINEINEITADVVFATDGMYSAVRYKAFQKLDRFNYSQQYIADGYRELVLPANEDGTHKLSTNTLHIWPRGRFMLIALPNFDGSFTCTLFMPFEDDKYSFNQLTTKVKVTEFFKEVFPDFFELLPEVANSWDDHPLSSLAIIRCLPWQSGKVCLMGDAAHATVPFYGQGMNAGFEDCSVMCELMKKYEHDWSKILHAFEKNRKPNADALQDLSVQNYLVMRNKVADPQFLLLQKIERRIHTLFPNSYFPMYSMVSFTNIEYQIALQKGNEQEQRILNMMKQYTITTQTNDDEIDTLIQREFTN